MFAKFGCGPTVVSKRGGGYRQTDRQTERQTDKGTLQLYIVDYHTTNCRAYTCFTLRRRHDTRSRQRRVHQSNACHFVFHARKSFVLWLDPTSQVTPLMQENNGLITSYPLHHVTMQSQHLTRYLGRDEILNTKHNEFAILLICHAAPSLRCCGQRAQHTSPVGSVDIDLAE